MYFKELTVTTTVDVYTTSGLKFNADGLELLTSKVDKNEIHSYLPFDLMTNSDRWQTTSGGTWYGSYSFSLVDISAGGTTIKAARLEGQNLSGSGSVYALFQTDMVAQATIDYSFSVQVESDVTFSSDFELLLLRQTSRSSGGATLSNVFKIPAGTTLAANTEYSYSGSYTPSLEIDPNDVIPYLLFQFIHGANIKIYNNL